VLSCHGFAVVAQTVVPGAADGHALAHVTDEAHHHHDDGTLHADDSDESMQHLLADLALAAPVMPVEPAALPDLAPVAVAPPQADLSSMPMPYLEGPRRPPRSAADLT